MQPVFTITLFVRRACKRQRLSVESRDVTASDSSCTSDDVTARVGVTSLRRGPGRRKKPALSARDRNLRRLESNERERQRMHGLNDALEVSGRTKCQPKAAFQLDKK